MRVRIKFTKTGSMRFLSHLDIMRYFQKALRRAEIDVALSEGFSPHLLMSFALPLSLGQTSIGEYFDVDLRSLSSADKLKDDLNAQMCSEISVLSVTVVPDDKANKCMALIKAADYTAWILKKDGTKYFTDDKKLSDLVNEYFNQEHIIEIRKTKRNEEKTDIKPFIYSMKGIKESAVKCCIGAGSVNHLRCDLLMNSFLTFAGISPEDVNVLIRRDELYALRNEEFVPLCDIKI